MTNRFSKVGAALWRSKRFKTLPDDAAKLLYLYFVTSDHQTSIGAYHLPDGYALDDLAWELTKYKKARAALLKAELIAFDEAAETVYVERWFKHCPPQNEKHAQGCMRLIGQIESEAIAEKVQTDFDAAYQLRNPIPSPPTYLSAVGGAREPSKWTVQHRGGR